MGKLKLAIELIQDSQIRSLSYKNEKKSLNDGGGLRIVAKPDGRRVWIFKYTFNGKRKETTFGTYPKKSLKGARNDAKVFREHLNLSNDPLEIKRVEKHEAKKERLKEKHIIEKIVDSYFELEQHNKAIKDITIEKATGRIKNHFYPFLPNKEKTIIHNIAYENLVFCLKQLEEVNKLETLFRVKRILIGVFKYAYTEGIIEDTERFAKLEVKTFKHKNKDEVRNNPALTKNDDIQKLYKAMLNYDNNELTKYALLFSIHTGQRQGSIITAKWENIDFSNKIWKIPTRNMKMGIEHELPLSDRMIIYLKELYQISGGRVYLFPNIQINGRHMSSNTVNNAIRIIGYTKDEQTAHGLRATFKTICKRNQVKHNLPNEFVEMCLAHKTTNKVEEAYIREKNIDEMRVIMNWWSNYLERLIND